MRIGFYLIAMLTCLLFMTNCQSSQKYDPTRKTLRLNFTDGDLPSLAPADLQEHIRGRTIGKLLYEGLLSKTAEGKVELAGAEKVEVSADGKEYLFTLRKHFWSDGAQVTAFHFEQGWKALLDPLSSCAHLLYIVKNAKLAKEGKIGLDQVGVRALDEKHLLVTLEYPSPYCLEIFSHQMFAPMKKDKMGNLCFNGPFIVDEWQKERILRLKSNPYFWNTKNVHLNEIEIFYVNDGATGFSMYLKGEIDWVGSPFCPLSLEDRISLQQKDLLIQERTYRPLAVYFNTEKKPFNSIFIRRAFSQAIDRDDLVRHILIGDDPLMTPLPPGLTLSPTPLTYDKAEAKANFEKGLQELGLSREKFPEFELNYPDTQKTLCLLVKDAWEKTFGIKVNVRGLEWGLLKSNLEKGNFETASCKVSSFFPDPIELLERYEIQSTDNICHWLNPDFQKYIALARNSSDAKLRNDYLRNAEAILVSEVPYIPISNSNYAFSHPKNLKNVLVDSSGHIDLRWAYWTKE